MKILILSWEFPPEGTEDISNYVYNLSCNLQKLRHEVHVITKESGTCPLKEVVQGVYIYRVKGGFIPSNDFIKCVMQQNYSIIEEAIRIIQKIGEIDIIHANGWDTAYAAKVLKGAYNIPLVFTIHSTEYGRTGGINTEAQRYISSSEWTLASEANKIIVCSNYMKNEIKNIFSIPSEKINVIPYGIDLIDLSKDEDLIKFRLKYAKEEEKIIFYLSFSKKIQIIEEFINEIPFMIKEYPKVKFIIEGNVFVNEQLALKVNSIGMDDNVKLLEDMDIDKRNKLFKVSNMCIFPSAGAELSLVMLKAMAAGCPLIACDDGSAAEILEHKVSGLKFVKGSISSLRNSILEILMDENLQEKLKENGFKKICQKHLWDKKVEEIEGVYEQLIKSKNKEINE